MRLTLSESLNILWQMCSLQSGTDDIEENDADNAFHNKARNLSCTGIDAAVKNGAADEIADNHDNDTDNAGSTSALAGTAGRIIPVKISVTEPMTKPMMPLMISVGMIHCA